MRKQDYVNTPNCVIIDAAMYSSTKRVLVAMLAHCSKKGMVRKSLDELAALSHCSPVTVRRALAELEDRGIVYKNRCFRYSDYLSMMVNGRNAYQINRRKLQGSYTLVPRALLTAEVSHSTFVAALYIYKTAGRDGRCWPSLRHVAKRTDLSKATVCRALKALRRAGLIEKRSCHRRGTRIHCCNSYYPTAWVRPGGQKVKEAASAASLGKGGLIFNQHRVINKITGGYTG